MKTFIRIVNESLSFLKKNFPEKGIEYKWYLVDYKLRLHLSHPDLF